LAEKRLNRGETLRIVCFDDDFGVKGAQGRSEFLEMLRNERAEHLVEMNPRVPFSSMLPLLSACDIGVIAYGRKLGVTCQPNRIFEYMAVGLPVIVPDYAVELRPIIEKYHCGLAVDMERPEAIAEAVVQLVTNRAAARKMGRAGREGSLAELNMEREIRPLIEWIRQPREQAGHENKAGR
jgi:glycosyltransferase involved in cell wall biosynthesis